MIKYTPKNNVINLVGLYCNIRNSYYEIVSVNYLSNDVHLKLVLTKAMLNPKTPQSQHYPIFWFENSRVRKQPPLAGPFLTKQELQQEIDNHFKPSTKPQL
jgi:hypothetical protein